MSNLAPIIVFAYKRVDHIKETLLALSKNKLASQSELYIFCDAAKTNQDLDDVKKVRELVKSQSWPKSLNVIERDINWGLSKSIVAGVSEVINKYGKVIVLEDDQVTAEHFLIFCNQALDTYEHNKDVMQISGYMYPVMTHGHNDTFFVTHSSCWGWATWKRAWNGFNGIVDLNFYEQLKSNKKLRTLFDMNDCYPYFEMLKNNVEGKNDSWGINWYAEIFKKNGLTLMPRKTLVKNIGRDSSATHSGKEVFIDQLNPDRIKDFPQHVIADLYAYKAIGGFLRKKHVPLYKYFLKKIFC